MQHRGAPLYGLWYNNVNSNKPLSFQVCSIIVPCSGQTTCADMLERVYFTEKSPTNQGIPKWLDMVMMVFRPGFLNPGPTTYSYLFYFKNLGQNDILRTLLSYPRQLLEVFEVCPLLQYTEEERMSDNNILRRRECQQYTEEERMSDNNIMRRRESLTTIY